MTNTAVNEQTVYDWFDSDAKWKTNPPFLKGSAGTPAMPSIHVTGGDEAPRIQRGFIRRSDYSINDDASMARLYFMYNPETISRDYMNYLDQGALDPFNTVFQSGNLVAPPSMLNFSFELFFDRQEEAMAWNSRGVMVDMEYFDLVVRNVKPSASNNTLPDNGIMMVNPRDITVVFSKEITVQGRPLNASVIFERFTHKMVPTRMRINLQMRVVYFGPMRDITTFVPETVRAMEAITYLPDPAKYEFDPKPLVFEGTNERAGPDATTTTSTDGVVPDGSLIEDFEDVEVTGAEAPFIRLNMAAASHAKKKSDAANTQYADSNSGKRMSLWGWADCSSFVWAGYAELGLSASLGWQKWGSGWCVNTANMYDTFSGANSTNKHGKRLWGWDEKGKFPNGGQLSKMLATMVPGDLLLRHHNPYHTSQVGHVAYVTEVNKSAGYVKALHSASNPLDVTISTYNSGSKISYNYGFRPYPHT